MSITERIKLNDLDKPILARHRLFDRVQKGFMEVVDPYNGGDTTTMRGQCTQDILDVLFGVTNGHQVVQKQKNRTLRGAYNSSNPLYNRRFSILHDLAKGKHVGSKVT